MGTAVLFSGQGAQFPGMFKGSDSKAFAVADRVLGRSISSICFEGSQEELNLTHNTQPCMLAADLAAFDQVVEKVDCVAGFSLGEYAALVAAGALDIEDAFRIVQIRADAMQEAVPVGQGAMAAIMKVKADVVQQLCDRTEGYVIPANFNCPGQIVVSGETIAVEKLLELCKEERILARKLPVSAPFHCKMMQPAANKLAEVFEGIRFKAPIVPVFMNYDGKPETNPEEIKKKLLFQTVSPVRWIDTLQNMEAFGADRFIECGPGHTLTNFVKKTLRDVIAFPAADKEMT